MKRETSKMRKERVEGGEEILQTPLARLSCLCTRNTWVIANH